MTIVCGKTELPTDIRKENQMLQIPKRFVFFHRANWYLNLSVLCHLNMFLGKMKKKTCLIVFINVFRRNYNVFNSVH